MGMHLHLLLLQYYFVSSFVCNAVAFVEEPAGGRSDGYCGRILRAQTQGTRREGHHEFRLRMEGDPETYLPGNTYRVSLLASSPAYFRGFTLIALKEGREGTTDDDYAGQFQNLASYARALQNSIHPVRIVHSFCLIPSPIVSEP
ncbi:spondin-1 [Nematolebias whitei]|uniref:spondin-1 n=1 Tax=Nematolebias whitei TaxID=451745 RepID=UPI00189B6BF4|nr:spondin-1 [Nematolebias whitei]